MGSIDRRRPFAAHIWACAVRHVTVTQKKHGITTEIILFYKRFLIVMPVSKNTFDMVCDAGSPLVRGTRVPH